MHCVIRIIGLAGVAIHGTGTPTGWVKKYQPEAFGGLGYLEVTNDLDKALKLDSFTQAMRLINRVPRNRPERADGKPNKPITTYHLEIQKL